MKRKVYLFLVFIILVTMLAGCWSRRELNELAIVVGMGVDKSGDQFKVTAQIINPEEVASTKGGGGSTPFVVYSYTGDTIYEAIRKMTKKSPRKLYAAHLRLLIIGDELASEKGIGKALDLFSRDPELRMDYFVIVAKKTTAEQVLKILTVPLEKINANKIFESLEDSEKSWAATRGVKIDQLISEIVFKGQNPLLTGIQIIGDPNEGEKVESLQSTSTEPTLLFPGLAAFKKDKLIGWLDETESIGANYIIDKVDSTIVNVPCPNDDGFIGIELVRSKTNTTGLVKNDMPIVNVSVQSEASVGDVECTDVDLSKNSTIRNLETKTEEDIKSKIEAALKIAQKDLRSDVFGFGEVIHQEAPRFWKRHAENWDNEFVDLPVNVNVDIKIRRIGKIGNSFLNE